jgi:hypothetical protein
MQVVSQRLSRTLARTPVRWGISTDDLGYRGHIGRVWIAADAACPRD